MEDIIKSIKAHLYDRATSPLSGAFVVSWIAWNYKFVVTLLSSMGAHEKFEYISTFLYATTYDCYWVGIGFPLLTTLAYIYVYPYIGNRVYGFSRAMKKDLMERKIKADKEEPISSEKAKQLHKDMDDLRIEHEKELDRKNSENQKSKNIIETQKITIEGQESTINSHEENIVSHRKTIENHERSIENLENEVKDKTRILSGPIDDDGVMTGKMKTDLDRWREKRLNLLEIIEKSGVSVEHEIINNYSLNTSPDATLSLLDNLVKDKLLLVEDTESQGRFYTVSNKGRDFLMNNKLSTLD